MDTVTTCGSSRNSTHNFTIKLTICLSRLEGCSSTTSVPAWIEGYTQIPTSSDFKDRFIFESKRNWKSSSLKCIEHNEDVLPGSQFFLFARTKSIHFFLRLCAIGFSEFRKGILCILIPFAGSAVLSHRAATHLSGIFDLFNQSLDELSVKSLSSSFASEVTCSLTYVTSPLSPWEDWDEWCAKMAVNLSVFKKP